MEEVHEDAIPQPVHSVSASGIVRPQARATTVLATQRPRRPTTIAPTATTIAIILTFVIGRRAASSAE